MGLVAAMTALVAQGSKFNDAVLLLKKSMGGSRYQGSRSHGKGYRPLGHKNFGTFSAIRPLK